ncbi:MAG: right-handed parallel beta-helix repeat-containing protein [Novacetimonas hansenii]|uniref:right-handed parallel beta-helix repeat-containing protein n=1 Tax=Novacetimonas hansenii TaxID=436 RepID=UPI0039ED2B18
MTNPEMTSLEDFLATRGIQPSSGGIVLPPGFYEIGNVVLDGESVSVRAEHPGTVTFEGSLRLGGNVTFEGITFSPALDEDLLPRMDISQGGRVTILNCHFRGGENAAIALCSGLVEVRDSRFENVRVKTALQVSGECSRLSLERCVLDACMQPLVASSSAYVGMEQCELIGSAEIRPQVVIKTGAQVTLEACHLRDGLSHAVWVKEQGQASITGCTISGFHKAAAIRAQDDGSKVDLSGTILHEGKQQIFGQTRAMVALTKCELIGSAEGWPQITMATGAQVTLEACHLRDGLSHAIWVKEQGQASITGCTISGFNKAAAISVQDDGSKAILSGTTLREGLRPVYGQDKAMVALAKCELIGSAEKYPQVTMTTGAQVTLEACHLRDGWSNAVWVKEQGQASITGCTISGFHEATAIHAHDDGSKVILSGTILRDGKQQIYGETKAMVALTKCELIGSTEKRPQVTMATGAQVTLEACRLRDGLSHAIWVKERGQASVRGCTISGFHKAAAICAQDTGSHVIMSGTAFSDVGKTQFVRDGGTISNR